MNPADQAAADRLVAARDAHPILRDVTYLNTGSLGIMAGPVADVHLEATRRWETHGLVARDAFLQTAEEARRVAADLVGADPASVALTGNVTDGINIALAGLGWRPGDELVISDQEHPGMRVPAHALRRAGVVVHEFAVSSDDDETVAGAASLLTDRTRLLAASHVTSPTGARLPVERLAALAREHGVLSLVDGAHAVGQFPVDVASIGCDAYVSCGHKWLLGPKGTGFAVITETMRERLVTWHAGDGSQVSLDDGLLWHPDSRRFEYGTRDLARWPGFVEALRWLDRLGWGALWARMQALTGSLRARVADLSLEIATPVPWDRSSAMTAIRIADADEVARRWRERDRIVVIASRPGLLRVSTAYYNNEEDLDRLVGALREASR